MNTPAYATNAPLTQREIAAVMGISRQRVAFIEHTALLKCARKLGVAPGLTLRAFRNALLRAAR